jgi:type II secretory pathway predicted ATPase ExeA
MKIRSSTELQDFLDADLKKRKRELTSYKFLITDARIHEKGPLLRAAIPLVYAHWEGFIKYSSIAYLDYVARKNPVLKTLKNNFMVLAIREKMLSALNSKKTTVHEELLNYIFDNMDKNVTFDPYSVIDTESNLSSIVLKNIMHAVGLDFDDFWEKKVHQIDNKLLKHRNEIAHGELVEITQDLYEELHDFVIVSLEQYKTLIENAAYTSSYQKTS